MPQKVIKIEGEGEGDTSCYNLDFIQTKEMVRGFSLLFISCACFRPAFSIWYCLINVISLFVDGNNDYVSEEPLRDG